MNYDLVFKAVVGSQSYGLATPTSDEDIKGIYIQPEDDFLRTGKYVPHIQVNKDEIYYELRNFLELLAVGNPAAIELLATPHECVLHTTPIFEELLKFKSMFYTKKLYDSFGGYALNQIKKAKGLDKKFNWEKSRVERKTILDFCKFLGRDVGVSEPMVAWLIKNGYRQEEVGLTKVEGFRDTYKVYVGASYNRGITKSKFTIQDEIDRLDNKGNSNEVRVTKVPKEDADNWVGTIYFNKEAYSTHCRDYKSYHKWLDSRNETRYKESREGQQYDSKNIMHTARLIITVERIHESGMIDIDMTEHRDFLLKVKHGNVDLEKVFNEYSERAANIAGLKKESDLPEEVNLEWLQDLELLLRKL